MKFQDIKSNARSLVNEYKSELESHNGYDNLFIPWDSDSICYSIYIGSVFSIMPSGKFYMPWACSNVNLCSRCKGKGCSYCGFLGSREAFEDDLMYEQIEFYLDKFKFPVWLESGEGDPCDLFIVRSLELNDLTPEQINHLESEFPEEFNKLQIV